MDIDEGDVTARLVRPHDGAGAGVTAQGGELGENGAAKENGIADAVGVSRGNDAGMGLLPARGQRIDYCRVHLWLVPEQDHGRIRL